VEREGAVQIKMEAHVRVYSEAQRTINEGVVVMKRGTCVLKRWRDTDEDDGFHKPRRVTPQPTPTMMLPESLEDQ
jgi:hypothetical protein